MAWRDRKTDPTPSEKMLAAIAAGRGGRYVQQTRTFTVAFRTHKKTFTRTRTKWVWDEEPTNG